MERRSGRLKPRPYIFLNNIDYGRTVKILKVRKCPRKARNAMALGPRMLTYCDQLSIVSDVTECSSLVALQFLRRASLRRFFNFIFGFSFKFF